VKLPFRRNREISRGQAIVEFALILPLLLLFLLLALDFGRVFFGWVALNNAARIAANEAGFHPEAWQGTGNLTLQNIYRQQVANDMASINCVPPGGGSWTPAKVPDPTFVNVPGTFSSGPYDIGDHSNVRLVCNFSFLTPLVGAIVGNPLTIVAVAEFPVKGGQINGVPIGGAVPTPTPGGCSDKIVPNLVGQTVAAARAAWTLAGFTGAFSPSSGSNAETVTTQTTSPLPSSPGACLVATASVSVTHQASCTAPQLVGLKTSQGGGLFSGTGFTGTYTINRPPANDYFIGSQSLVGGQIYLCSSSITVFH
jgi:TadE-like protein